MLQLASPQRDRLPSSPRFVSARSQLYSQRLSECSSQSCSLARCNLVAEGCGDFRPSRAAPDIRGRRQALSGSHSLSATVSSSLSATLSAESVSDAANSSYSQCFSRRQSFSECYRQCFSQCVQSVLRGCGGQSVLQSVLRGCGGASISAYSQCIGFNQCVQSVHRLQSVRTVSASGVRGSVSAIVN